MKHILLVLITFLCSTVSFSATNYDSEWKKVDNLMNKSALNDASQAVQKIIETAKTENNTRQLLLSEIYSYAIDLGCDYSLHERKVLLTPSNFDKTEGIIIIDQHYANSRALLSQLSDKGEIALCRYYLLHLISEYYKIHYYSQSSSVRDTLPTNQLKKMTYQEIRQIRLELQDSLFTSLEALHKLPAQNYSDLLIFSNGEGETMADIIAQGLLNSAYTIHCQPNDFSNIMPTITELTSRKEEAPYTYGETYFKHIIYEKLICLTHLSRDTNKCIQYDIKRIDDYLKWESFVVRKNKAQRDSLAVRALDTLIALYPNDSAIIKAEALRAKVLREKTDTINPQILHDRLLSVKEKFKNRCSLDPIDQQLDYIDRHKFQCHVKDIFHSNEPIKIYISHTNVKKVLISIQGTTSVNGKDVTFPKKKYEFSLKPSNYFIPVQDSIQLENLPYGDYCVYIRDVECKDTTQAPKPICFVVTDIATICTPTQNWWEKYEEKYDDEEMDFKTWCEAAIDSRRFYHEVYAVDNISGKPLKGVNYSGDSLLSKSATNQNGKTKLISMKKMGPLRLPLEDGDEFRAEKGDDRFSEGEIIMEEMDEQDNKESITIVHTDRAIYRPGQTVKFFGFCYRIDREKRKEFVMPNQQITIKISHKGKTIATTNSVTDQFGKFHGEYSIENNEDAIGEYCIKATIDYDTEHLSSYFHVEAYKLQQIEVEFDQIDNDCTLTKEVPISGTVKYLSGEAIANAQVLLTIEDEKYTLMTDSMGKFSTTYTIHPEDLNGNTKSLFVTASITAPSGESIEEKEYITLHKNTTSIRLVSDPMVDIAQYPYFFLDCCKKDSHKGEKAIEKRVKIQLKSKKTEGKTVEWEETLKGVAKVHLPEELCQEANIGSYQLTITDITTGDTLNKTWYNSNRDYITIYDSRSKVTPTDQMLWISIGQRGPNFMGAKDTLRFSVATNKDSLYVLYRLADHNNVTLKEEWMLLNKELRSFAIPYKEIFSKKGIEGAIITVSTLKDHQFRSDFFWIEKSRENMSLHTKITSLRNKIESGSHQKWNIEVIGTHEPVSLAATMTDMALNTYKKHHWNSWYPRYRVPFINYYNYREALQHTEEVYICRNDYEQWMFPYREHEQTFAHPLWSLTSKSFINNVNKQRIKQLTITKTYTSEDFKNGYMVTGTVRDEEDVLPAALISIAGTAIETTSDMDGRFEIRIPNKGCELEISYVGYETQTVQVTGPQDLNIILSMGDYLEEVVIVGYGVQRKSDLTGSVAGVRVHGVSSLTGAEESPALENPTPGKIRKDFTESAFFYPDIQTKDGKATIEFDAPETLTNWEVKLFTLSKDMKIGVDCYTVQTTMPFNIRPYVPRLFRSGDRNVISAVINNHEELAIAGKATILLEEEKSGKEIGKRTIDFNIAAHQNDTINCSFDVPEGIDSIKMTVIAENDRFKDGEIHAVPVISNCSRTIKAQNAMIRKGETKTLTVDTDPSEDVQITVEYTANSLWQAVMSLPSVAEPKYSNAIDLATAFYANAIISKLHKSYPSLNNAIKNWGGDSKLKQNNELKSIAWEATPWRKEAQNETEQREAVTYMLQNAKAKRDNAFSRLRFLQNKDYGYAWFPNGESSPWTSIYVCQQMAKLYQRGLLNKEEKMDFKNSLQYIDKCIEKRMAHYNSERKNNSGIAADEYEIRLMWLRHFTQELEPLSKHAKLAVSACYEETKQNWKHLTLYGKSCFVQLLVAQKDTTLARTIVEAMRQSYTRSSSEGIYWKENKNACSWYNSDISVHTEAMRAFIQTGLASEEELAEMQLWLLRKKETGVWRSTTATIDAIDILLQSSNIESKGGSVTLPNGEQINAADGYLKRTMPGNSSSNTIHVEGAPQSIGFAALYATQETTNSKITAASNHISIDKKAYSVESRKDSNGHLTEVLKEIKEGDKIPLGSKIKVRLTVESDQNLDYLLIKDERASCMEPEKVISQYIWDNQACYYRNYTDTSYRMFFNQLTKGTYIFDYTLHATTSGTYSAGLATAECLYSPSFRGNSNNGGKITVGK
ncbi:MAG: carboxypeptidase-like regulatory domain-containing protein [Paludibacteraceae bacterium]|nr:carboxypeptidase-like regulatory domain-containing protein [Paludibacteraceae bacterium]